MRETMGQPANLNEVAVAISSLTESERSDAINLILGHAAKNAQEPVVVRDLATGLATALLCPLDQIEFVDKTLELKRRCLLFENAKRTGDFQQLDPVDLETVSLWMMAGFPERFAD
jgi:hypothetical protein